MAGQYTGFILLLLLSVIGAFGALIIPKGWIGLLGLIPIFIGIKSLVSIYRMSREKLTGLAWFMKTSAITFVSGADNIGVYIPLFLKNNLWNIALIIGIFLVLIGLFCYLGLRLVKQPFIAQVLERNGQLIVPVVFITLGTFILFEHNTFHYLFQQ